MKTPPAMSSESKAHLQKTTTIPCSLSNETIKWKTGSGISSHGHAMANAALKAQAKLTLHVLHCSRCPYGMKPTLQTQVVYLEIPDYAKLLGFQSKGMQQETIETCDNIAFKKPWCVIIYTLPPIIMEAENGPPKGDDSVIFQAPIFHETMIMGERVTSTSSL